MEKMTDAQKMEFIDKVLDDARQKAKGDELVLSAIDGIVVASGVAEAGCDDEITVLGNWNTVDRLDKVSRKWVAHSNTMREISIALDKEGINTEWIDEWSLCGECGKIFRVEADCFGWEPSFVFMEHNEVICRLCLKSRPSLVEDYLDFISGKPGKYIQFDFINPADFNYVKLGVCEEYNREVIQRRTLMAQFRGGEYYDCVFKRTESRDVTSTYELWGRKDED